MRQDLRVRLWYVRREGRRMIHEVLPVGVLGCNCSILGDEQSRKALVIDPGAEIPAILARVAHHGLQVQQILVTHAHIDHIAGALSLQRLTGAPISYNQDDLPLVAMMDLQATWIGAPTPEVHAPDESLADGSTFRAGGLSGIVLHTPGHTPGSLCLYLPEESLLLAGDTLFRGSIGRTDLPGGDASTLLRSIYTSLKPLPEGTRVIPGHGPETTIGREVAVNPYLQGM